MPSELEKRMSKIEKRLAERAKKPSICNCRVSTSYHNAKCLLAVLKGMAWVCPIHGFRNPGRFWFTPQWAILRVRNGGDDNRFCPCPPHPWRTHVLNGLNGVPRTSGDGSAAEAAAIKLQMDAFDPLKDRQDANRRVQEEGARIETIVNGYWDACHEWYAKYGQELIKRPELAKVIWERARENESQESSPSL
jgi:hypothetical protein